MDVDCFWLPGILIYLSHLFLQLDLFLVEECVRAQGVFLLILQMLFKLSNVVFLADLLVVMHADFDVTLVASDVLNLELDGPVMAFRFDLDIVTPHDAELY